MIDVRAEGVEHPTRATKADATKLLKHLGLKADLSVLLCDDAFIRNLNAQWRKKDQPTDVLSFPMDEDDNLGDVVISVETARRQAEEHGHSLERELRVLLVHGLCHVLGFDHETGEADAAEMRAKEAELLALLGEDTAGLIRRTDD
ncbi:MAG: rRNA maturation RNase YbeY [Myxococcota bacterium]